MGLMLRRNPKQVFTIFDTWNLKAFWRRLKKLQWPWAPYNPPKYPNLPRDTKTHVIRHKEEFLRPTPNINPYEPEVIALAVKLGMKEKSKREYAEAAFDYVKNSIYFNIETPPSGPVESIKKGYGLCLNKMMVLAALSRVAGIPARFVTYKQEMAQGFIQMMAEEMSGQIVDEISQEFEQNKPLFTHGCLELLLDNDWVSADLTWTDEEEVGMDLPISKFGESPFGKWYNVMPDTVSRSETLPWRRITAFMWFTTFMLRGLYDRLSERTNQLREVGRKQLAVVGRETYINRKKKLFIPMPRLVPYEEMKE